MHLLLQTAEGTSSELDTHPQDELASSNKRTGHHSSYQDSEEREVFPVSLSERQAEDASKVPKEIHDSRAVKGLL